MPEETKVQPKTFYLNEQHELARAEKEGGGRAPKYAPIDWAARGPRISSSLQRVKKRLDASPDPTKENHYFVVANPVAGLTKLTTDKKKAADGTFEEPTDFSKTHSRVFGRLGMDLLRVTGSGSAIVHMKPETLNQLEKTSRSLSEFGTKEQARWATIDKFEVIPWSVKIDADWIGGLPTEQNTDAVIELQPLLSRAEIDRLIRKLAEQLNHSGERITGTGSDFSGRQWLRGRILPTSLKSIADSFFSVQSLHSPLISDAAAEGAKKGKKITAVVAPQVQVSLLPTIAVVDTGVVANHAILSTYRRGIYVAPTSTPNNPDTHGCFVASRVVFGDLDFDDGIPAQTPAGSAGFYDVNVSGAGLGKVEDKSVYPALQAVVSTAPDVRVFNCSFDTQPLNLMDTIKQAESLSLVQDLDNFIFQNDVLVIVAAGNSPTGILPAQPYPLHFSDPQWQLGAWARSFNSLTCGSLVRKLSSLGLVGQVGWPSAFTRVGPGLCGSPKPDFAEHGGNSTETYNYGPGLGVWGLSPSAMWEDRSGTSHAAPLLAREVALCIRVLDTVCEKGARPFGVTVKAVLALTAEPTSVDSSIANFSTLATGRGLASTARLQKPRKESAVLVWQGVLEDDKDIARVQIPIPQTWLADAGEPCMRLVVSWDPPVNSALTNLWATRKIQCHLRATPESDAIRPARPASIHSHASYPLLERLYKLKQTGATSTSDGVWLLEIFYEQIGEYFPSMQFPGQQRVAFAAELIDRGKNPVSPQSAVQALPIAATMTRLTIPPMVIRTPVVLKTNT